MVRRRPPVTASAVFDGPIGLPENKHIRARRRSTRSSAKRERSPAYALVIYLRYNQFGHIDSMICMARQPFEPSDWAISYSLIRAVHSLASGRRAN